jgi:hypothetical protein
MLSNSISDRGRVVSRAEVKNMWSFSPFHLYIFTVRCLGYSGREILSFQRTKTGTDIPNKNRSTCTGNVCTETSDVRYRPPKNLLHRHRFHSRPVQLLTVFQITMTCSLHIPSFLQDTGRLCSSYEQLAGVYWCWQHSRAFHITVTPRLGYLTRDQTN